MIPVPDVEIRTPASEPPTAGRSTERFRVISEESGNRQIKLIVEGLGDSRADLTVLRHKLVQPKMSVPPGIHTNEDETNPESKGPASFLSASLTPRMKIRRSWSDFAFHFPPGEGWKSITVTLTW